MVKIMNKRIWIVAYAFSGGIVSRNGFKTREEAEAFYKKMADLPYCEMYETEDIWS